MLPEQWTDKGFHFYSRVKRRGPDAGINTPSDLESEIRSGTDLEDPIQPNRHQIRLPITNSNGQHLKVVYDFNNGQCELVTLTY